MLCVIACDCQLDFLPGGAIPIMSADQILVPLSMLVRQADLVLASRDWHPDNHFSFSEEPLFEDGSWPPHCIQKTRGAKIHTSINKYADFVISKGVNRNPPDAYSVFAGKTLRPVETLSEILSRYPIEHVIVGGLPLDVTVLYTALDANAMGYRTTVPLDCTRPLVESTQAIAALERAGVAVVERGDQCHSFSS